MLYPWMEPTDPHQSITAAVLNQSQIFKHTSTMILGSITFLVISHYLSKSIKDIFPHQRICKKKQQFNSWVICT